MAAQNVEFVLIAPSSLIISTDCQVEIHLKFTGVGRQEKLWINAEQEGRTWNVQEIDGTTDVTMVNILSETVGAVKLSVRTHDGGLLGGTACIVSVPQSVHDNFSSIFEQSTEDLINAVRAGSAKDTSLTVVHLKENPLLVKRVAWRDYFRGMIADYAVLLDCMNQSRRNSTTEIVKSSDHRKNQLQHLISYFLKNNAYDAGTFLLKRATASGYVITLDGVQLNYDGLDLQRLQGAF